MSKTWNITEYGASNDGVTCNTRAIQKVIDSCEPGDTIYIPVGVFLTGALFLKSHIVLKLAEHAVLQGTDRLEDYPIYKYRYEGIEQECYSSLINAGIGEKGKPEKDITICGKGCINANGVSLRKQVIKEGKYAPGRAIALCNVNGIIIRDVTLRQSPAWCLHLIYSQNVLVDGVQIHTKYSETGEKYGIPNGDGIDIDSCRKVAIIHSMIASQDDCIAIKSGKDADGRRVGIPTEDVTITDCQFYYGFGVAMGSEMSGGVRNVVVKNCDFHDTYSVASVKAPRGRGAVIENILYQNLTHKNESLEHQDCRWFRGAIYIDQFYSHEEFDKNQAEPVSEGTPIIRNITLENVKVDTVAGNAIYLCGLPESHLKNITLRNVTAVGIKGLVEGNVEELILENVEITERA